MSEVGDSRRARTRGTASGVLTAPADSPPRALRALLVALTGATGLIDAVSYLGVGHVFVANMTGNVALLGFALSGASGLSVAASLAAIAGFLVGAVAGGRWGVAASRWPRLWLPLATAGQTVLAVAAATLTGAVGPVGSSRLGLLAVLGVAMGIQNATVRQLAIPDLTTTVLTQTLTGLAAESSFGGGTNVRWLRRAGAVAAMLVGALAGGLLTLHAGLPTALAVTAVVFALVTVGVVVAGTERTAAVQPAVPSHSG